MEKVVVAVPVIDAGEITAYVRVVLFSEPIAQIYDDFVLAMAAIFFTGLLFILGFGLLTQLQINHLNSTLSRLLDPDSTDRIDPAEQGGLMAELSAAADLIDTHWKNQAALNGVRQSRDLAGNLMSVD